MLTKEYSRKIECFIANIPKRIYKPVGEFGFEGFFTYDRLTLDEAKTQERHKLEPGTNWGVKYQYGWFFSEIVIPEDCKGKKIVFSAKPGECVVFVNGDIVGAFDKEHSHITLTECAVGGEHYDIAMEVYAGHCGLDNSLLLERAKPIFSPADTEEFKENVPQRTISNGNFGILHDEIFMLWMDIKVLYELSSKLDSNSLRKANIDKALTQMCDAVNIELPIDEFLTSVKKGRQILKSQLDCVNGSTAPKVYAIGHAHLDLEWLWTRNETRRKIARTLGNQLRLIAEYPNYKYIQSQPWLLEVVKNEYPRLFEEIKKAVKSGNIVVEGGTWVEPDTNIPSGESLIRQFIFGKKFIRDEFDKESEIFWLPDSFGMTGSLPQIMKGCGIKYFMNAKLIWQYNGGDPVPHHNFVWQGIDGSEILSAYSMGYGSALDVGGISYAWNSNSEKAEVPAVLVPFGHSDGGGGATRIHLEYLKREANLEGMPCVIPESPNNFFKYLENNCEINARYVGELYYAAHRGSYTSRGIIKKLNRQSEFALRDAEMWSALLGNNTKSDTDRLWKTLLFNQFHDILPGTSIIEVCRIVEKELTDVIANANQIADASFAKICSADNEYITVFNSLASDRSAYITLPDGYTSADSCETQTTADKVIAKVDLPACGFKSFRLGKETNNGSENLIGDNSLVLENRFIRAEFNEEGELISLVDKETETEYLHSPSNVFRMYQNMPTFYDAWDIDSFYKKVEVELDTKPEIRVEYRGKLESCITIKKQLNNSLVMQRVILREYSKRLDFITEIDWNEIHKILKVDFNTNIHTDEMISEIQHGYVKRPTHKTRVYDEDRFEVCNHKWSALCEGNRGAAILNNCKYGISAERGTMSLTLLTSPMRPTKDGDHGIHKFTYSFMPFSENIADSSVQYEAYDLNCPVKTAPGYADTKSLIGLSEKNIILDTVKFAEDGSGDIVVRMFESTNSRTNCKFSFGFDIKSACLTNMIETTRSDVEVENNAISLTFNPFEVITLRLSIE